MIIGLPRGQKAHFIWMLTPYYSGKLLRRTRLALKINNSNNWLDGWVTLNLDGLGIQYGQWRHVNHKLPETLVNFVRNQFNGR